MANSVFPFPVTREGALHQGSARIGGAAPRSPENRAHDDSGPFGRTTAAAGVCGIYRDFTACPMRRLIAASAGSDPVSLLYRYFAAVEDGLRRPHAAKPGAVAIEACVIELLAASQAGDCAAVSARLCWLVRRDHEPAVRMAAHAAAAALAACGARLDPVTELH